MRPRRHRRRRPRAGLGRRCHRRAGRRQVHPARGRVAADAGGLRVLRGSCDPLHTPRPLGPFRDIAPASSASTSAPATMPLNDVCEQVYDALRAEPTVLVVEDLHWVDAASVDVLRFLARRVGSMPLALLVSYRDNEIDAAAPRSTAARRFRARWTGSPRSSLQPAVVRRRADAARRAPALEAERGPRADRRQPFLRHRGRQGPGPSPPGVGPRRRAGPHRRRRRPRTSRCSSSSRPLRTGSTTGSCPRSVSTCRRCAGSRRLVCSAATRGGLVFRHELARHAVESTIPPGGGVRLHARLLDALERIEPRDPAVLTHHAVAARRRGSHGRVRPRGGREEAVRAGSHTEAAAFFETALEHLDGDDPRERAELLMQLGYEQYMTSRLRDAIRQRRVRRSRCGARPATAAVWPRRTRRSRCSSTTTPAAGRPRPMPTRRPSCATDASAGQLVFGAAQATRGYLAYHARRVRPRAAAGTTTPAGSPMQDRQRPADPAQQVPARGRPTWPTGGDDARSRLADHIESARAHGSTSSRRPATPTSPASTSSSAGSARPSTCSRSRCPFTVERDIPICRHWQTGVRSRLHLAQGHWSAALEDAGTVLVGRRDAAGDAVAAPGVRARAAAPRRARPAGRPRRGLGACRAHRRADAAPAGAVRAGRAHVDDRRARRTGHRGRRRRGGGVRRGAGRLVGGG